MKLFDTYCGQVSELLRKLDVVKVDSGTPSGALVDDVQVCS